MRSPQVRLPGRSQACQQRPPAKECSVAPGGQVGGWVVRYLDKGVAETLADTLDGDLGVAVVVAVIVAHSHLHKKETDAGVRKVAVCSFCPDSSTDQLAMVQQMRRM